MAMKLEHLSYKTITVILLVAVVSLSIVHTIVAKLQFRDATFRAQTTSLSRVIEVASDETLKNLRLTTYTIGNSVQQRLVAGTAHRLLEKEALRSELDDLFIKGFVDARSIDLVKLRVYDLDLRLVTHSEHGLATLPELAPAFLREQALPRQGVERLKALGGLWSSPEGPLYSQLLPIGGLKLLGYLEVVVDPTFNLGAVSEITKLPMRIETLDGKELFTSANLPATDSVHFLPIEYLLRDARQQPLYRITAYENISDFYAELHSTQLRTTVTFVVTTLLVLALVLIILNRFLFHPVSRLISDVQHCIEGDLDTTIDEHGVKEVHLMAHAFNTMSTTIRNNINELQRLSSLDGLTGIANRRAFDQRFAHEWARAARHQTPLALLLIDIDYFKRFNDSLGHQAGDQCLRAVAETLQGEIKRPTDMVARYGGEEFVVLLSNTDVFGAGMVALKMRDALQRRALRHPSSEVSPLVTLSVGINVRIPAMGDTPHALLEGADKALYEAKRNGRNSVSFAPQQTGGESAAAIVIPLQ